MHLELQHGLLLPTLLLSTAPEFYVSVLLREMLQGAVHHLCVIIKNELTLNVLQRVENTLKNAIQQGYIVGFSDLVRFINEEDFTRVRVNRPSHLSTHLTDS